MKIVTITGLKLQCDSINNVSEKSVEQIIEQINIALSKKPQFSDLSISVTDDTKVTVIEPVFSKEVIYG